MRFRAKDEVAEAMYPVSNRLTQLQAENDELVQKIQDNEAEMRGLYDELKGLEQEMQRFHDEGAPEYP